MTGADLPNRNLLGDLVRIGVGLMAVAAATAAALEASNRTPRADRRVGTRSLNELLRNRPTKRRKPPESGISAPAVPPRGPLPMQGGAAARLNLDT